MASNDLFRFCIYCGADCYADDPEHTASCPSVTRVYPVTRETLAPYCTNCKEPAFGGMRCCECHADLNLGDHYTYRTLEEGDGLSLETAPIREVICLGCAAQEAVNAEQ